MTTTVQGGFQEWEVVRWSGRDQRGQTDSVAVDAEVELVGLASLATWGVVSVGAAAGSELCAAIDRDVAHVDADVGVIERQAVFHQLVEHAGVDPFVAAGPQRRVRDPLMSECVQEPFSGFPGAAGSFGTY